MEILPYKEKMGAKQPTHKEIGAGMGCTEIDKAN